MNSRGILLCLMEATPSSPGWEVPPPIIQTWDGYLPVHTWDGAPPVDLGWGTPTWTWDGVPPVSWMGYPLPGPGMGYPPSAGWGTPHLDLGWGTLLVEVWTDKQTENSTFSHPTDAGGKNPITRPLQYTRCDICLC